MEESYEQLVARHYRGIYGFVLRLCGHADAGVAEDLTQETFLRLWTTPPKAVDDAGLRRWLLTVARNLAMSHFRRPAVARAVDWESCPEPESAAPSAAIRGIEQERAAAVRRAVEALPRALREAILLREFEELRYEEIAEVLGVPVGTVRSRLARARAMLAERLAELKEKA